MLTWGFWEYRLRIQTLFLGLYVYSVSVGSSAVITVVDYSSLSILVTAPLILLIVLSRLALLAISLLRESDVKKLSMMTFLPLPVKHNVWDASPHSLCLAEQGLSVFRQCVQRVSVVWNLMPKWFLLQSTGWIGIDLSFSITVHQLLYFFLAWNIQCTSAQFAPSFLLPFSSVKKHNVT